MKVSRLKIKNLGPFHVTPVVLDFENGTLADASLVAITGRTGAGKTMLFDAICVALYGKTPRLDGNVETHPRNLLSHDKTGGHAEVIFEANGTRYLAEWSMERGGAPSRQLIRANTGESIAAGSQVTEKIKAILGLDFTDFRRSVMLAQGDFAAFLRASPGERLQALVKAADIGVYDDLARTLKEKTRLVEAAYAEAKLSELKKKADSLHNDNGLWRLREEVIEAFEDLQSAVTAVCETKEVLDRAREDLRQRRADFKAIDDAYRRAENAANVAFTYVRKARETLQAERELLKLGDDLIARDESLDEVERELAVQTLVCKRADAEVSRLEAERELAVLAVPIKDLRQRLKPGDPCLVCGATEHPHADQVVPGELLDIIEKELAAARTEARKAKEQLASLTQKQGRLRESKANIVGQVEVRQSELENLKAQTEASRVQWREIYPDTEISEWAPLAEIGTVIRKLEAAFQEKAPELDIPKAEIDVIIKELEDAVITEISEWAPLAEIGTVIRKLGVVLQEKAPELDIPKAEIDVTIKKLEDAVISEWAPLVEIDTVIRKLEAALQEEATERDIPEAEIDVAIKKFEDAVREKKSDCDAADKVLGGSQTRFTEARTHYENRRSYLAECTKNLEIAHHTYKKRLWSPGFDSRLMRAYDRADEEKAWVQEVKAVIDTYTEEDHDLEADTAELHTQFKEPPFDLQELERITAKLAEIDEQLQNVQRDIGAQEAEVEELERSLPMYRGYEGTIHNAEREMQRWSSLQRVFLVGRSVANLNDFPSFAAEMVFRQLSTIANTQLEYLTSGRYQLKVENISKLAVVDKWNANKERPVETLSGGESFLTSFALALGLSELSRGRAQINSLFLDEGFGTLDAETLDTVINALEGLRLQGRSVFLISHIEKLTRHLPVEIRVRKGRNGSSTVDFG